MLAYEGQVKGSIFNGMNQTQHNFVFEHCHYQTRLTEIPVHDGSQDASSEAV